MVAMFIATWAALIAFFFFGLRPYLQSTWAEAEKDRWTQGL